MGLFSRTKKIKVSVVVKGRIGPGWYDIDETVKAPEGITLSQFIQLAEKRGIPFQEALENSPHLKDTLMLNGDRCPVADNADRVMQDGDEMYLLAPLAGG